MRDELLENPLLPLCFIHVVLRIGYSDEQSSDANLQSGLTGSENLSARFALAQNFCELISGSSLHFLFEQM
jgi:hypothetical protein